MSGETTAASTIGKLLCAGTARLREAGIDQPRFEARLLLEAASGLSPAAQLGDRHGALPPDIARQFTAMVARRAAHEPLSRITGRREFWSLNFRITPATLDPRPDTETVVEAVLAARPDRQAPLRLLDLGTGTGCIALALLQEYPRAQAVGVDRSAEAAAVAQANARALGFGARFLPLVGDWTAALHGDFDVIVSNPPYIPAGAIAALVPEVRDHDPLPALVAGEDGLDAYRALAPLLARHIAPGGLIALEVGLGQSNAVAALLTAQGLQIQAVRPDLAGIPRCVLAAPSAEKKVGARALSD